MLFYDHYEYAGDPLVFTSLPGLTEVQAINLLVQFDEWYGNTDQDTNVWALEYQVFTRMLVHNGALILNPRYLALEEVRGELLGLLNLEQEAIYTHALEVLRDTGVEALFAEEGEG